MAVLLMLLALILVVGEIGVVAQENPVVRMVFFYRDDCEHCITAINDVLIPVQEEYGERVEIKMVQFHDPEQDYELDSVKYEMFIRVEEMFGVPNEERGIPTLIAGGEVLVGDEITLDRLRCLLDNCLAGQGTEWPTIPGLADVPIGIPDDAGGSVLDPLGPGQAPDSGECSEEEADTCSPGPPPVWAAYFYQTGCDECDRAESDIAYVKTVYPQFQVEEFNINESVDIAQCLAKRAGREQDLGTPALFIGDDALIGRGEITPQNIQALVQRYVSQYGAGKVWEECGDETIDVPGVLTVLGAGLIDGLNPCAFATLIFFVSYLTVDGRKGREALVVGMAFTLGVFLTYMAVGIGLWRLLDEIPEFEQVGRWFSGAIGLGCAVLAGFSFRDYFRARNGEVKDMALVMPEGLRKHTRAVIRKASGARSLVLVALPVGAAVSLLELACTGQVYLPIIIFTMSNPAMRAQAVPLLLLYNLAFIVPLIVVFVLVYFGTTSQQLGLFLKRRAAGVKLATAVLFVVMGAWLIYRMVG